MHFAAVAVVRSSRLAFFYHFYSRSPRLSIIDYDERTAAVFIFLNTNKPTPGFLIMILCWQQLVNMLYGLFGVIVESTNLLTSTGKMPRPLLANKRHVHMNKTEPANKCMTYDRLRNRECLYAQSLILVTLILVKLFSLINFNRNGLVRV